MQPAKPTKPSRRETLVSIALVLIISLEAAQLVVLSAGTYVVVGIVPGQERTIQFTQVNTQTITVVAPATTFTTFVNRTVVGQQRILAQGTNLAIPPIGGGKSVSINFTVYYYFSGFAINFTVSPGANQVEYSFGQSGGGSMTGTGSVQISPFVTHAGKYTIALTSNQDGTMLSYQIVGEP